MDKRKLIEELKSNPKNVRFRKLCKIAEAFDFRVREAVQQLPNN